MGLDLYAGTLTRYYTHNWQTAAQQFAEANGMEFQIIRPGQNKDEELSPDEIKGIVTQWRDAIVGGLKLNPVPLWNEDYDVTPYYTDKPDWDALNALLLYIAAKYSGKEVPATVDKDFDVYEHPIVKEFLETKDFKVSLFDGNGWWLPVRQNIIFDYVLPNSEESPLTTSALLLEELKAYNAFEWNADRDTIVSWSKTEGYPADATYDRESGYKEGTVHETYATESLAKFAFSILWQAAEFSLEHGVVIVYDF
ncbi:MAG: hypothetical protein K1W30_19925 [Lachnospiraceae bacterium]